MLKVKQTLFLLLGFGFFLLITPIGAIEEAPSLKEDQQKADLLRKEVEAILAETDGEDSQKLMIRKAFCGNLVAHQENGKELSIEVDGQRRSAFYNDQTVMIGINRERITPQDLEMGNYLVAMGYVNRLDPDKLEIRRLVIQETPPPITRESFFGLVSDISSEEEVFVLTQGDLVLEVLADKASLSYQDKEGKIFTGKFERLEEQNRIVMVGQRQNNSDRIKATKIHIATPVSGSVQADE